MSSRAFLFVFLFLSLVVILTSPPILGALVEDKTTPTATSVPPTPTSTATPTPDPFGHLPTATPLGGGGQVVPQTGSRSAPSWDRHGTRAGASQGGLARWLLTASLDELPPTLAPVPTQSPALTSESLPWVAGASPTAEVLTGSVTLPVPPTPAGPPPDRIAISRLGLEAPVEPIGMVPSDIAPGVVEWGVPDHRAAGWLNTSAAFGVAGNTVLDGHHNIQGEVFRDLWTLQAGDEIVLYAGSQARRYVVHEVLILPEKDQPLEARLANARYLLPTDDERLTLVTCWPYENNTHRTVVMAFPQEVPHETP
jgi:LPXTG-site transpeptidase (sortase) family protein